MVPEFESEESSLVLSGPYKLRSSKEEKEVAVVSKGP